MGSDEQTLPRGMLDTLGEGDILLGDAFYPTYFLLCDLVRRGIAGVFEQYGARKRSTDFRTGKKLGPRDHLVTLTKPKRKPDWMSQEDYDQCLYLFLVVPVGRVDARLYPRHTTRFINPTRLENINLRVDCVTLARSWIAWSASGFNTRSNTPRTITATGAFSTNLSNTLPNMPCHPRSV
jgi:hypothetical protein